jgi:Leucine-rich repeat (LRR) protein
MREFMTTWLVPHSNLMDHLAVGINITSNGLALRELCEAAAPCRSLALYINQHLTPNRADLRDLAAVAGNLRDLNLVMPLYSPLHGFSAISGLSQLTRLCMDNGVLPELPDPWALVAELKNLKSIFLAVTTRGDPSALSGLTGLTSLELVSRPKMTVDYLQRGPFFNFSSLHPLSTLQELEVLRLEACCMAVTSLHGLAGLSKLQKLNLCNMLSLMSLQGASTAVTEMRITEASGVKTLAELGPLVSLERLSLSRCGITSLAPPPKGLSKLKILVVSQCFGFRNTGLRCLSGIEELQALQEVTIDTCRISSLEPIGRLSNGLQKLWVRNCPGVQEEVLQLPYVQPTADVRLDGSNVQEVVLAGGTVVKCGKVRVPMGLPM